MPWVSPLKFAMKCSHIYRSVMGGQVSVDVYKDPVTDHSKASKAGRLDLIRDRSGNYQTVALGNADAIPDSVMQLVFENGEVLVDDTFDAIRTRAKGEMV